MGARMSEKEWAAFTANRYIDPYTGKRQEQQEPILDDHDFVQLQRTHKTWINKTDRMQLSIHIWGTVVTLLIVIGWLR